MNRLTFSLFILGCIVILLGIIKVLLRDKKKLKKEKEQLKNNLEMYRNNIKQLSDFIINTDKVSIEEKKLADEINGAKSDEEVNKLIYDIINLNNSRVQNN